MWNFFFFFFFHLFQCRNIYGMRISAIDIILINFTISFCLFCFCSKRSMPRWSAHKHCLFIVLTSSFRIHIVKRDSIIVCLHTTESPKDFRHHIKLTLFVTELKINNNNNNPFTWDQCVFSFVKKHLPKISIGACSTRARQNMCFFLFLLFL